MSAPRTRSPSRVSTMRTVPCIAGCDGPMLICMGSVGISSSRSAAFFWPRTTVFVSRSAMGVSLLGGQSLAAGERLALVFRVVLAQRVTLEGLPHEHAAQVG